MPPPPAPGRLVAWAGAPGPGLNQALQAAFWEDAAVAPPGGLIAWLDTPTLLEWRADPSAWPRPLAGLRMLSPVAWVQEELRQHWGLVVEGLKGWGYAALDGHQGPMFLPVPLAQHAMTEALAPWVGPGRPLGPEVSPSGEDEELGLLSALPGLEPAFLRVQLLDALGRGIEGGRGLKGWQEVEAPEEALRWARAAQAVAAGWWAEAQAVAPEASPWPPQVAALAAEIAAQVSLGLLPLPELTVPPKPLGLWPAALAGGACPSQAQAHWPAGLAWPAAPTARESGLALRVGWMAIALAAYMDACLRRGCLDPALAQGLHGDLLWPNPAYQASLQGIQRGICERLDERSPRWQGMLRAWVEAGLHLQVSLAVDPEAPSLFSGGLRQALGADPHGAWAWAKKGQLHLLPGGLGPLAPLGRSLAQALLAEARQEESPPLALPPEAKAKVHLQLDHPGPLAMLDAVGQRLVRWILQEGVEPREVVVVCPRISPLVLWALQRRLEPAGIPLYLAAGTNRLQHHRAARSLLTLADWAKRAGQGGTQGDRLWQLELLELATQLPGPILHPHSEALSQLLDAEVARRREAPGPLGPGLGLPLPQALAARYPRLAHQLALLATFLAKGAQGPQGLGRGLRDAFGALMLGRAADPDFGSEAGQREASLAGQVIELAEGFEALDARWGQGPEGLGERWQGFLAANPVMARPFFQREPHEGAILLASPAKLAEVGFAPGVAPAKKVIWLDAASQSWRKRERRELNNGRVLAPNWGSQPYGRGEEESDELHKLALWVWALGQLVGEELHVEAAWVDELGQEQEGTLARLLAQAVGGQG